MAQAAAETPVAVPQAPLARAASAAAAAAAAAAAPTSAPMPMPAGAVITPAANPPPHAPAASAPAPMAPAAPAAPAPLQRAPPPVPVSNSSPRRASSAAEADAGQLPFQQQVGAQGLAQRQGAARAGAVRWCCLLAHCAPVSALMRAARTRSCALRQHACERAAHPAAPQVLSELEGLKQQMRAMAAQNQGLAGRVRQLEEVVAQQRQALERMQQKQQSGGGGVPPGWTDGALTTSCVGPTALPCQPACRCRHCSSQTGGSAQSAALAPLVCSGRAAACRAAAPPEAPAATVPDPAQLLGVQGMSPPAAGLLNQCLGAPCLHPGSHSI
jgi:hypothetical protein